MYVWRAHSDPLGSNTALANRVHSFDVRCGLYGHFQESFVHALFEFDHVMQVWNCSLFATIIHDLNLRCIQGAIGVVSKTDRAMVGEFIAVMWVYWNLHNEYVFSIANSFLKHAINKALNFVTENREAAKHF